MRAMPAGWEAIYALVRRIPRGRVATYGQVAALLGKPRAARQVGFAMAALRGARHDVPWHRVLGARPSDRAGVSILDPMGAAVQRAKLEAEGVRLDDRGQVELSRHGWARVRRLGATRGRGARRRGEGAAPAIDTRAKAGARSRSPRDR